MTQKRRRHIQKNKSYPFSLFLTVVIYCLILLIAIIAITYFFRSPQLQPMRESALYALIITGLLITIMIYFTWFHRKRPPVKGKLLSTLVMIRLLLPSVISSAQTMLIIDTGLLLLFGCYVIFVLAFRHKSYAVLNTEIFMLVVYYLDCSSDYEFVHRPNSFHFGGFSLVLAIIVTITTIFLLINGYLRLKNNRQSDKILLSVIVFYFSFILFHSVACHLNYALDKSTPAEYSTVIEAKDIKPRGRSSTDYIFYLQLNDSRVELRISQSEYHAYEVGDFFLVDLYQGAFDDPFYISGNK